MRVLTAIAAVSIALVVTAPARAAEGGVFENTTPILIPVAVPCCSIQTPSLYPSSITVTGAEGIYLNFSDITVTLNEVSDENIPNLAVLLVAPDGRALVLMAGWQRNSQDKLNNRWVKFTPTFEDLGETEQCVEEFSFKGGSTYVPLNCGLLAPFPAPAPGKPYVDELRQLTSEPVNGVWRLYAYTEGANQVVPIAGGWSLRLHPEQLPRLEFAPRNTMPPSISGAAAVGQTLTCWHGEWIAIPERSFSYQWQRDGAAIPGATGPTYVVQAADQAERLTCEVIASNKLGQASAVSAAVMIPGGSALGGGESGGGSSGNGPTAAISSAQIAASLARQLTPSPNAAKIAPLLKRGALAVSFNALEAGTVAIAWYQATPAAKSPVRAKAKAVLVAFGKLTFPNSGSGSIKVRLTAAGKKLLKRAHRLKLTAVGTFTPANLTPITATRTFVLKP